MAEIKKIQGIKRASLNNVISKSDALEITNKEFLVSLGVPESVADKLLELSGKNGICTGVYNSCETQCNGDGMKREGIKIAQINDWIKQGVLKETDFRKEFITKIRQK